MAGLSDFGSSNLFNKDGRQAWDQTFAALTRQQWGDYVRNFVPYENRLIDYSSNPQVVADAMGDAGAAARQSFTNRAASSQRGLRELGLTLTPEEQSSVDRSTSLAGSLADVNAQNAARDATLARQRSVLGNPAPSIPKVER